jgi:2-dehydropantoate 2-reductase
VSDIHEIKEPIDYLLVTVKDKNMPEALRDIQSMKNQIKAAFSFQNGITHEEELAEVLGWGKVVGGVTIEGADMPSPGTILYDLSSTTYFGEFDGSFSPRITALAEIFKKGGMDIDVIADVKSAKWTKFVQICAASGVCGATRLGYSAAVRTLAGAQIYTNIVKEGVAVMRAKGVEPGKYFLNISRIKEVGNLPLVEAVDLVRGLAEGMYKKGFLGGTSLARDIERGRKSEVDALMGTLYRIGEEVGVPTPTIRTIYWVVKSVDEYGK